MKRTTQQINATSELERIFGISQAQLGKIFDTATGGRNSSEAYADIYFQSGSRQSLSWDQGKLRSSNRSTDHGAGVRVLIGDKTGFSYTDRCNFTNVRNAAKVARAITSYTAGNTKIPADSGMERQTHSLYDYNVSPLEADFEQQVELLAQADKLARDYDSRIDNVSLSLSIEDSTIIIATSFGDIIVDHRPLVRFDVTCYASDGKKVETAHTGGGARTGFDYLSNPSFWQDCVNEAAKESLLLLDAEPAPAGEMTVVLGNGWPGILIHEAVGHGLEGDYNRTGASAFSDLMGEQVASDLCTIVDDGTIPGRRGSLNYDDEGVPTGKNVLIENGRLVGYMQDRMNSRLMDVALTGNGRRERYDYAPLPRMTNTYLAAGESSKDEIISSVKKGIYAVTFGGGQVDTTSGNFTFSAKRAYLIENGKLTATVKGATLIGNGPQALKHVSMVGDDLELDTGIGVCGKQGQSVPVGVGTPTVRINKMTVGGTAN